MFRTIIDGVRRVWESGSAETGWVRAGEQALAESTVVPVRYRWVVLGTRRQMASVSRCPVQDVEVRRRLQSRKGRRPHQRSY